MKSIWEKSVKILQKSISEQHFDTWIKPLRILSTEGNGVNFAVPNRFFRDWLTENYLSAIRDALQSVAGHPYQIHFVIEPDGTPVKEKDSTPLSHDPSHKVPAARKTATRTTPHTLNTQYSFERFVVGSSNQFAHAAAMAVAEKPAKNYNPLFIYGGVGLGKTHLVNAVGLHSQALFPEMNILYVSAEEFMNELINAIRYDKTPKFREKYRNIDCLLIDDIQFIAGKERTQEEFFHTFNTLQNSGRQIVVTSDRLPNDIPNLENRLRSRFEWGLIADIQPPEFETKMAILEKKAQESRLSLPPEIAHYIASLAESNIRELEGYLIRIAAYASLTGRDISLELVKEALKQFNKKRGREDISIEEILKIVSTHYSLKISDICSQKKDKNIAHARQVAMYLSRKLTTFSFPDIGGKIGIRHHSTVIHACNKITKLLAEDNKIKKEIKEMEKAVSNMT